MNVHSITKILLLFIGAIIFNYLFWQENLGLNVLIYSSIIVLTSVLLRPESRKSPRMYAALLGVVLTGGMIVYHNSLMAKFTHFTSLLVFFGFVNQPSLKAIFHALPTGVVNFIYAPYAIISNISSSQSENRPIKKYWRTTKLVLLPLAFFWVFYVIFYFSNPVFANYSDRFWSTVGEWMVDLLGNVSIPWILLLLLGIVITGWAIFKVNLPYFVRQEERLKDIITRKQKGSRSGVTRFFKMISLKNEFRSALYLVIPINVLLLTVNVIDINWLWFNFEYDGTANLSAFVHEGTYLLIFSILLSIGILLYFFRKNLNFFPNKKILVLFASIWILQNFILVISVGVRNYHYIHYYGLAYKRIGVMFFLIATVFGLVTLFIKIRKAKTSYYLLRANSWNVYALLIVMSLINWDMIIVKHNVNHSLKKNIDLEFLLTLSDKTLPTIHANFHKFEIDNRYHYRFRNGYKSYLDRRIEGLMRRKEQTTWKSWNFCEEDAYRYFKSHGF
ncbi:MAG: DUF4173 domain-containing protein [Crocinitomicaceae bacterium]